MAARPLQQSRGVTSLTYSSRLVSGQPTGLFARPAQRVRWQRSSVQTESVASERQTGRRSRTEYEQELQPGTHDARPVSIEPRRLHDINRAMQSQSSSVAADPYMPGGQALQDNPLLQSWDELNDQIKGTALGRYWDSIPAKYRLVFATSVAFVICNMDKVNISVAIIPMARDFGWSPTISGLVQSSFFYGYMLSQIPGGYITSRLGGRKVLPAGVALWSGFTAAVPLLAGTIPGLFASRAAVGLGEGVAPSAATDMVARTVDPTERSRAISFIFGGLHVGSLLGLLVAPGLIERFGWATVFYIFGAVGLVWTLWFEWLVGSLADHHPEVVQALKGDGEAADQEAVPWRAFLRSGPVRALAYTHFCNNWFHYTMMAWLPSYLSDSMSLTLSQSAQLSILPPAAAIAVSAIAGTSADLLIERGWPVNTVRKAAQCTAFLSPAAGLTAASMVQDDGNLALLLITASLGMASFSLAGLYSNHADLSPKYSPVLLGLTNTSGAVPGIIGVACTGYFLDQTGSWPLALFAPSIFFFVTGSAVFSLFGSTEPQKFEDNSPFGFEKHFAPVVRAFGGLRNAWESASRPLGKLGRSAEKVGKLIRRPLQGKGHQD